MRTEKPWADPRNPAPPERGDEPLLVPRTTPPKKRLFLWVLLLLLVGASLALSVLWQRDAVLIDKQKERLEPFRLALESAIAASGRLPLALPRNDPQGRPLPEKGFTYLPAESLRFLRDHDGEVMVGYSMPGALALRANGRAVVLCHGASCTSEWLSPSEFVRLRDEQEEWIARRQEELLKSPPKLP